MKVKRTVVDRIDNEEIEIRNRVREYYRYGFEFFRRSEKFADILQTGNGDAFEIFKVLYPYNEDSTTFSVTMEMTQPFQLFKAEWSHKLATAKLMYEQQGRLQMFMQERTPKQTLEKWDKCLKVFDLRNQENMQKQAKRQQGTMSVTLDYNAHMGRIEPAKTKMISTETIAQSIGILEQNYSLYAAYNRDDIRKKISEYYTEAKRLIKSAVAGTFPK